ncbi:uncharacterized protein BO66DRAFT_213101 [Aspergillus aculeatinus CBS 121060]|uniref:Uncharacterized protein n=2 Tax=Aspergillus subgen. Circumdati TaxID=2720871 RepID=A0ACD1GW42_9EURO|nr:hypothetical protein BO95DRAFT_443692 [Aspergillus brunneoviolaceus CBS 621.78]XP_025499245.1 hypothetical protein BO66DRAFT_213101 [Aspergillus aculeatinus CBS 121060]RAH44970.1 hypothetical protein BO95DRAFT_443692 [Aspergillus brunneoviolaceus CBS 621.78]RAH65422.1 hypothetical protein BO66DRAFT_213101 [Aspergillus aculeatinus CBS 121060]
MSDARGTQPCYLHQASPSLSMLSTLRNKRMSGARASTDGVSVQNTNSQQTLTTRFTNMTPTQCNQDLIT